MALEMSLVLQNWGVLVGVGRSQRLAWDRISFAKYRDI
jgi:hypothetical protein